MDNKFYFIQLEGIKQFLTDEISFKITYKRRERLNCLKLDISLFNIAVYLLLNAQKQV